MQVALRQVLAGLITTALILAGASAAAESIALKAELKGSNQVPPNKSTGTGNLELIYDPAERKLSWKGSYAGLSGAVTAAHFHGPAMEGRNAGIALVISANGLPPSFEGSAILSPAQVTDLLSGRWYINLHTAAYPAGEIRGQVHKY
ncbi:MAG TPA: CHRD domain-containing protein [Xanthobacteraceae bacterium]|nr:CHRD domain-containing protein [Xanthobacteraceae bacterium]